MFRTFTLLLIALVLAGCGRIEADSEPYFNGSFVGYYLTSQDAMPAGIRLELQASNIEQKRYTIAGTAAIGEASFTAEGYELASDNLDYLAPQAYPPPQGSSFIALKDGAGATMYTLCAGVTYRDYSSTNATPLNANAILIEGAPQGELDPAYCSGYLDAEHNFATVALTKQSDY